MTTNEANVTAKVGELMTALDEVKRYRALSRLIVDFAIIVLSSIVLLSALELYVNLLRLGSGFPGYFSELGTFTFDGQIGGGSVLTTIQLLVSLSTVLIPTAGILLGVAWVDHRLKSFTGGEWRTALGEGFPGALSVLQGLNWGEVFDDMRVSRIGYMLYFVVKVFGYFLFTVLVLFMPFGIGFSVLHTDVNFGILGLVSLVLVLAVTWKDLQRRYERVVSLDTLMWELRWFSSEIRSVEFKA